LKYCTARSCFSAAARVVNVPKFRRLPVLGLIFREYSLYFPDFNFRIIGAVYHGTVDQNLSNISSLFVQLA